MQAMNGVPPPQLTVPLPLPMSATCYGHNGLLLLTRERILRLLGCKSDTVESDYEFRASLGRRTPSIILLCQTLSKEESTEASRFVLEHGLASSLVLMYSLFPKYIPDGPHVLLPSRGGPNVFSETMVDLLKKHTSAASLKQVTT